MDFSNIADQSTPSTTSKHGGSSIKSKSKYESPSTSTSKEHWTRHSNRLVSALNSINTKPFKSIQSQGQQSAIDFIHKGSRSHSPVTSTNTLHLGHPKQKIVKSLLADSEPRFLVGNQNGIDDHNGSSFYLTPDANEQDDDGDVQH
eukprot:TRINITY_DN6085_c0_g1_i2.p1 TRINITY_DN6085_c0_g1~~TRINITY_DN6085_c0_g1_i2.p1  ORF type:complete len:146 (-),score=38.80 TRINITY_DN6085_c0_g1_i2:6-443(-)